MEYVNINGAFFQRMSNGSLAAVNDPNTLRGLRNGTISATSQSSFGNNTASGNVATPSSGSSSSPGPGQPGYRSPGQIADDANIAAGTPVGTVAHNNTGASGGNRNLPKGSTASGEPFIRDGHNWQKIDFGDGATAIYDLGPISNTSTNTSSSQPVPNPQDPNYESQLAQLLANPDLSADQVTALREYFTVVAKNDSAAATRMISSFNTGMAFSSPVFQAQVRMLTDALQQGLSGITGNLANAEESLRNQRDKLVADTTAANEQLDFNSQQQLANLKTSFDQNIQTNADNMAATGRASSSVRLKSDQLLNQNYEGLVESNNRTLAFNRGNNLRDVSYNEEQTNLEIQRLRDKATADRIAALRETERGIGSEGLGNIPGLNLGSGDVLGGIGGTIERDRLRDAFGFATNFF